LGTDGVEIVSPRRGTFKGVLTTSEKLVRRFVRNDDARLAAFAACLAAIAAATAGLLVVVGASFGSPVAVGTLALLAVFAERQTVRLGPAIEISVSSLPLVFAAVVFGPLAAMAVGVVSMATTLGRPHTRWIIWTSIRAIVGAVTGVVALAFGAPDIRSFPLLVLAVAAASLADVVTDVLLNSATVAMRRTGSVGTLVRTTAPVLLAAVPLYAPVIAVLAYAYYEISPLSVAFFLLPAFAAQRLFVLYREQREATEQLRGANVRLERANLSFATALVATLDARDQYTAGHSAAVAIYARDIAARMGLDERQQQLAHVCGLVHDIGKIGLPAGLLEKPGPLTLEERRQMETHAEIGERILANVESYAEIARIVRHHHERVDGHGYPDGLIGEDVPLLSRIIAVADAYNAMTSDRPYRDAMPSRVARLRLAQAVESQFDTTVVAAFEAILAPASEDYRSGSTYAFTLEAQDRYSGKDDVPVALSA
jgi:putative nucleotidyltransferase with HDIG domain